MNLTVRGYDITAPYPESDDSFLWGAARALGFGPMDAAHKEFFDVAFRLFTCSTEDAEASLDAFENHAVSHFAQEEGWMQSSEFPAANCHAAEHAAVLRSTGEVRSALIEGRSGVELVHDFAIYLFQWSPGHADYLDSALAAWMSKKTYGGKPVVFRRRM